MGYFLSKTWPWWLLAAVLAGVIAWLLCRLTGRGAVVAAAAASEDQQRQLVEARGRVERHGAKVVELEEQLRTRDADLESATSERDSLQARISALEAELRAQPESAPASAIGAPLFSTVPADAEPETTPDAEPESTPDAEPETTPDAEPETTPDAEPESTPDAETNAAPNAAPDVAAGSAALGVSLTADDLTAVEGIGPKIRDLIHATGVRTWRALSRTEVAALQQMLDAAGPRFRVHNPGTWPRQAGLLADGRWEEFKQLKASLRGGRSRT
ncbi:MAG: hypothetical protein ACRCSN_17435 [Dermatophilaceae bacterium]